MRCGLAVLRSRPWVWEPLTLLSLAPPCLTTKDLSRRDMYVQLVLKIIASIQAMSWQY